MRTARGPTMARRARTLLRGALQLAGLNNVLGTNPVRDVQTIRSKLAPKGAPALTAERVRDLLTILRTSEACQQRDRNTLQHSGVTGDGLCHAESNGSGNGTRFSHAESVRRRAERGCPKPAPAS
jgi:hypothetical protein